MSAEVHDGGLQLAQLAQQVEWLDRQAGHEVEPIAVAGALQLEVDRVRLPVERQAAGVAWVGRQKQDLVDEGEVSEEAAEQLLLVHVDSRPLPLNELPPLTQVTEIPIHAASFTCACASLSPVLVDMDSFYEHLDGIHGPLKNGRGVHIKLSGDGRAVVWMSAAADHVLVELK